MDEQTPPTLGALAAQTLDASNGDRVAASEQLTERLRSDPDLGESIIDRALKIAATQAIAKVIAYRRTRIPATPPRDRDATDTRALARGQADRVVILASSRLSQYPLTSGEKLADAIRLTS